MEPVKNTIQWASIPLLIPFALNTYLFPREKLSALLFETPAQATQKYDGTNVGKDERAVMYGRTLVIPDTAGASYQKTSLDGVRQLDVAKVKDLVCQRAQLDPSHIACFNLYGELMCNKSLYNYATDKLANTHQLFGAMIRPTSPESHKEILQKLGAAGFACMSRGDENEDEAKDDNATEKTTTTTDMTMLFMNSTFLEVLKPLAYPTVPIVGRYENLFELISANFEWMVNGMGEGLVIVFPPESSTLQVAKWKIGSEASANNVSLLEGIIQEIQDDVDKKIFGVRHENALAMFKQMLIVANSKKVNGAEPEPPKPKATPQAKPGPTVLSDEQKTAYDDAFKSAQSKFDHQDTFFEKNMKGAESYATLLAKEMLSDIAVDKEGSLTLQAHNTYVLNAVKDLFVAYKRNASGKK